MRLNQRTYRYLIVGAVVNVALYVLYLILTKFGVLPQIASTIGFVFGTLMGYVMNRAWAFNSRELHRDALPKYVTTYIFGYLILLFSVTLFVALQWPHELGQLLGMIVAAGTIFILLNIWVFPNQQTENQ